MQSRRSFFGALAGLAALLPLPAFARSSDKLPEFYSATLDTDFLELPPPVHVYAWTQQMNLAGEYIAPVLRIKIMLAHHIDMPLMFNTPNSKQRIMLPEFKWDDENKCVEGVDHAAKPVDSLEAVLARLIRNHNVSYDYTADGRPIWITQHTSGEPVRHRMACVHHEITVDDMILSLPVGLANVRILREPPSQFDAGEDGPWRAV